MSRVFTEEELALMKKLGMTPSQVEALTKSADKKIQRGADRRKNAKLTEYYLMHVDTCSLCGGVVTSYFKMSREFSDAGEYLYSIPITKEEYLGVTEKKESATARHLTCKDCAYNLSKLSHDELVSLAITLQRRMIK